MFGIGMTELIIILAVALIIIGPKKLPELARTLGKGLAEFRRATSDLKDSISLDTSPRRLPSPSEERRVRTVKSKPNAGPEASGSSETGQNTPNKTETSKDAKESTP